MLNIVIPMAGLGSRFAKNGYTLPKPLIEIHGKPMIQVVINNLKCREAHRFIFICLKDHLEQYGLKDKFLSWAPHCRIIAIETVTQGAACTVLLATDLIHNDDPLMIANSDQWIDICVDNYLSDMKVRNLDGMMMTMTADDPKWSFVRLDGEGRIMEVVEKKVVSREATVGIYNFKRGRDFVTSAENMIKKRLTVNNEYYVAPVYNEMIAAGKSLGFYNIGEEGNGMYGLGKPEDLALFLAHPVSRKAVSF